MDLGVISGSKVLGKSATGFKNSKGNQKKNKSQTSSQFFSRQSSVLSGVDSPTTAKSHLFYIHERKGSPQPKTITRSPTKEVLSPKNLFNQDPEHHLIQLTQNEPNTAKHSTKNGQLRIPQSPDASNKSASSSKKGKNEENDQSPNRRRVFSMRENPLADDVGFDIPLAKNNLMSTTKSNLKEPGSTKNLSFSKKKEGPISKSFSKKNLFKKNTNTKTPKDEDHALDEKDLFLTELNQQKLKQFGVAIEKMKKTLDLSLPLT